MQSRVSTTLSLAGIFSVVVGLGIVRAQGSPSKRTPAPVAATSATSSTVDHNFVLQAALSNMAEIQLGHMAAKKAQDAAVKKFAQTMVDDHLKAQQQLADAAYGEGIKWPTQLDEPHRELQKRLSNLNAAQFDRDYMKAMVDGHRDMEKMLAERADKGGEHVRTPSPAAEDGDQLSLAAKVSYWAAQTLPDVRDHLKEAEQVYGALAK
jgi:putative membrane protein